MELKDGKLAVELARKAVENFTLEKESPKTDKLPKVFQENRGAFVTLHTYPEKELRG
jgi:AMMECR1 domain-containing protein